MMIPYAFVREEGFYPLLLKGDEEAIANAEANPGTRFVIEPGSLRLVWAAPDLSEEDKAMQERALKAAAAMAGRKYVH